MAPLAPQSLPAVPHVVFGVFNLAVPNIIAWAVVLLVFVLAAVLRMPRFFGPAEPAGPAHPTQAGRTPAADPERRP